MFGPHPRERERNNILWDFGAERLLGGDIHISTPYPYSDFFWKSSLIPQQILRCHAAVFKGYPILRLSFFLSIPSSCVADYSVPSMTSLPFRNLAKNIWLSMRNLIQLLRYGRLKCDTKKIDGWAISICGRKLSNTYNSKWRNWEWLKYFLFPIVLCILEFNNFLEGSRIKSFGLLKNHSNAVISLYLAQTKVKSFLFIFLFV